MSENLLPTQRVDNSDQLAGTCLRMKSNLCVSGLSHGCSAVVLLSIATWI